ncbi:hypothetical protein [Prosthecomicrobium hirschii]|uniref:hypothetical protein n=1 Tax=Prosthecodimorpha hirschii TaxID=665126 RepID=UPI00128F927E|nr:hypothetical protein [Prosthecomicrobium hirschii]
MPNPREPDQKTPDAFTLRDVVERRLAMVFECANCRRVTQVDVLNLVARFGPEMAVEAVRFRARCQRCGKRRARPLFRDPAIRGDRAWWPKPPGATR